MRKIEVFLSQTFRATCCGYDPEAPYTKALEFTASGELDDLEACELAWSVCNSTPPKRCIARPSSGRWFPSTAGRGIAR